MQAFETPRSVQLGGRIASWLRIIQDKAGGDKTRDEFSDSFGHALAHQNGPRRWMLDGHANDVWELPQPNLRSLHDRVEETILTEFQAIQGHFGIAEISLDFECWMAGRDRDHASPTVFVWCRVPGVLLCLAKALRRAGDIRKSKFRYLGLVTEDIMRLNESRSLAGKGKASQIASLCGKSIASKSGNKEATLGGVICVDNKCYGLTVAHVFDPEEEVSASLPVAPNMDIHSEDDDDSKSHDIDDIGRLRQAAREQLIEAGLLTPKSTVLSVNSTFPVEDILALVNNQTHRVPSLSSLSPLKDRAGSDFDEYDWALVDDIEGKFSPINTFSAGRQDISQTISGITSGRSVRRIMVLTKNGVKQGQVVSYSISVKFSGASKFVRMLAVEVDGNMGVGDSGSWLIDAERGNLYGVIIAGRLGTNQAYALPIDKIIADMKERLGAKEIRLPDPEKELRFAVEEGSYKTVEWLLRSSPDQDLSHMDHQGRTLLTIAAQDGKSSKTYMFNSQETYLWNWIQQRKSRRQQMSLIIQLLIQNGADPNKPNRGGFTPLHLAVAADNEQTVKILLAMGAGPNVLSSQGTSLMLAVSKGYVSMVRLLLEAGADPNLQIPSNGDTPLLKALGKGRWQIVDLLLKFDANPSLQNHAGWTPYLAAVNGGNQNLVKAFIETGYGINSPARDTLLYQSLLSGKEEMLEFLILNGADLNACDNSGRTPLHRVAGNHDWQTAAMLLERGADPNAGSSETETPLTLAILHSQNNLVNILLSKGAHPNKQGSKGGMTPLLAAIVRRNIAIVEKLLQLGANPNQAGSNGFGILASVERRSSPLDLAVERSHTICKSLIEAGADPNWSGRASAFPLITAMKSTMTTSKNAILASLIEAGADAKKTMEDGQNALHYSLKNGVEDTIIKQLLYAGADVHADAESLGTPLHVAAKYGNKRACKMLLSHGADVNASSLSCGSPLHAAATGENRGTVTFLIKKGAAVEAVDHMGRTPLFLAVQSSVPEKQRIVQTLLRYQASVDVKDVLGQSLQEAAGENTQIAQSQLKSSINGWYHYEDLHAIAERELSIVMRVKIRCLTMLDRLVVMRLLLSRSGAQVPVTISERNWILMESNLRFLSENFVDGSWTSKGNQITRMDMLLVNITRAMERAKGRDDPRILRKNVRRIGYEAEDSLQQ